jgi:hypothetical protein
MCQYVLQIQDEHYDELSYANVHPNDRKFIKFIASCPVQTELSMFEHNAVKHFRLFILVQGARVCLHSQTNSMIDLIVFVYV